MAQPNEPTVEISEAQQATNRVLDTLLQMCIDSNQPRSNAIAAYFMVCDQEGARRAAHWTHTQPPELQRELVAAAALKVLGMLSG